MLAAAVTDGTVSGQGGFNKVCIKKHTAKIYYTLYSPPSSSSTDYYDLRIQQKLHVM